MTGRWDRTPLQLLEQQVRDLTAQLAQARKATDIATMRDILDRAGLRYIEEPIDDLVTLRVTHRHTNQAPIYFWFWAATGQLNNMSGGGEIS